MFQKNKYTQWYYSIIKTAKQKNRKKTENDYYESHHIIPKCMGGVETILLTAKEHYICHLLLCRMVEGSDKYKMINALVRMAFSKSKGQKRHTAKSYSLVRIFIAEKNRETLKGVPKSEKAKENMKGRCGVWKRTEKHKEEISKRLKKRFENVPGPFTGKKFTKEMAQKRNKTRKDRGIKPVFTGEGCKHFTNGVINKFCIPGKEPKGFYPGRTIKKKGCVICTKEKIDQEKVVEKLVQGREKLDH